MLSEWTQTSLFHGDDTLRHNVNCVFVKNVCYQDNKHELFGNLGLKYVLKYNCLVNLLQKRY